MTVAATQAKTVRQPDCGEDYYPAQALRLNQQGSVVVKICVGANNKIDGPIEVLTSSGFPPRPLASLDIERTTSFVPGRATSSESRAR